MTTMIPRAIPVGPKNARLRAVTPRWPPARALVRSTSARRTAMRSIDSTRLYFDRAADRMDLSENMRRLLLVAKREITVQIAVEMDNGEIATLIGYRVQHDDSRGPMKG